MKKNRIFFNFLILILFTVFLSVTCKQNIGLGGTVDIERPRGEITYPDAGETPIRGSFVMKGYAGDDDGINSITISFKNIETKKIVKTYTVEGFNKGDGSVAWSINIDNESKGFEASPHDLVKKYPIPDGEYTAILTVTDKDGKTYETTKNYKIDNTPPVFIVLRPSMSINESSVPSSSDQADGYGAIFSVVGQAGEKNTVEKLNVLVDGITLDPVMFVGNNINSQVAVSKVVSGNETDPLYHLQAQNTANPIRAQLYLYDNAREYMGDNASGEGNKADWYYQRDSIYTDVIAKGYTPEVISDYFAGKKGSDKNDHDKKIKELRGVTVADYDSDATEASKALKAIKSKMVKMLEKRSTFKLDPSKSPGFKVIGVKHFSETPTSANISQASSMLFKSGSDTTFSVELIPNKDNIPLVGGSDLQAYNDSHIQIVLLKWNGTLFDSEHPIMLRDFTTLTDTSPIKMEGGKLRVQCTFPSSEGEGIYAVKVNGTDTSKLDSNKFEAYDDSNTANGMYIINFLAVGTGPRIRPIRPQKYQNANFEIFADVTGIDSTGTVYYNIDAKVNPASPDSTKILTKADPGNSNDHKYKATIDISGLTDGDHTIHFLAKAGSSSPDEDSTDFAVDTTAPTADIGFPLPTDPQGGKITISGTINDGKGAGVKEAGTKYILGRRASTPALDDSAWQTMTTSTKGSWNKIDVDLDTMSAHPENYGTQVGSSSYYKVPFYIRSEDMLGNATVHVKEILFNSDGTKPVVRVISPRADAVVGGTIQIFGTASAVTGGPSAVGEVYVQFSKTSNFTNVSDMTFGTDGSGYIADWYQGGNGQLVPGTGSGPGQSGAEWRLEINGNGAFNGTIQRQDVYFRLCAKNKDTGRKGEWTTPIKIIVDKDAPLITDVKIENVSTPASPQNYETNMWIGSGKKLTAKLTDPSGIKEVKITSKNGSVEKKYQKKVTGSLDDGYNPVPADWLTDYTLGSISGYTLSIPLDISGMSGNDFSIKVEIKENTTTGLSSDSTFTFRFDTTPPKGFFGSGLYINSGYFSVDSITNAALADKLGELGANTSSGAGCKILAEDTELTVTGVSGSTVNFSPSLPTAKEYNYILYKPEVLIYDTDFSSPWIVNGVANDDGSGIAKVEAWVKVDTTETVHTTITETDNTNKITRQLGGQVTWKGQIDLSSLKDGKGKLHYKIIDKSGNTYTAPAVDVRVKNKQLKVTTITLSTDIGGSNVEFANDNVNKALKNIVVDSNLDFTADFTSSAFAFKNKNNSKIRVNFTGGQGQVKYNLKYNGSVLAGHDKQNISSGVISLSAANLATIGNTTGETTKELILELWDSAHDCTPTGTAPLAKSSFAEIKINTLFDALDTRPPTVVILPFHWNGENDNSLYEGKRTNGHVEIGTISGMTGSSVSGKVTIRGFAYDNVKIDSITATLPNSSSLTLTVDTTGNPGSDDKWESTQTMSAQGAHLTVEKLAVDYTGFYVKWQLDWDTEKAAVGTGKDIKVVASDGAQPSTADDTGLASPSEVSTASSITRNTETSAEDTVFSGAKTGQFVEFKNGEESYLRRIATKTGNKITFTERVPKAANTVNLYAFAANQTKRTVSVVPYITEIVTENTHESGLNKNTIRSSDGKYSIIKGNMAGFIKVKGFNLSNPVVRLVKETDLPTATEMSGTSLIPSDSSETAFSLSNNLGKSGYLEVFAGSSKIRAINNINSNNKPYNNEADLYLLKNKNFNDDRCFRVFDMQQTSVRNGYYPEMIMEGDDPVFGYIDLRGGPNNYITLGGAGTYYPSHAMPQRAKFNGSTGNTIDVEYLIKASIWDQMGMAKDDGGRYHHITVYDRDTCAMSFIYDKYAELYSDGKGWGSGVTYGNYGNNNVSHDINNNALTLETTNYDNSLLLGRYQYPKIIAKGDSKTDKAVVYMAYYDANTNDKKLIFRNFQIGKKNKIDGTSSTKFQLYSHSSHPEYEQWTNLKENTSNNETYSTGRLTLATSASPYFDMGVLNDGRVVVVYFDESVGKLKLQYSENPVTGASPSDPIDWTDSAVAFPPYTGAYVSMDIDSNNGIHIAAFDSSNGDLKYFYLDSYNSTALKTALVDAAFSVGQWTQIKVYNNRPYIAYYNNSEAGQRSAIKLAYAKDNVGTVKNGVGTTKKDEANLIAAASYYEDGFVTGRWECMTVPSITPAQGGTPKFKKVNLGFDTAGIPVLGYLGSNLEFGKWLDE